MSSSNPDEVNRLRHALGGLRVVVCDMRHEALTGEPAQAEGAPPVRPPLCAARIRIGNIACSHTSARLLMRDAWLLLERLGDPDAAASREELARLDCEISVLDHRRYDAETEGRADLVAVHVAEHRALGEKIEALRLSAIAALDRTAADQLKIAS